MKALSTAASAKVHGWDDRPVRRLLGQMLSIEIHREMENTHDKDAVIGRDVENAVPPAIELQERAAPSYNGATECGRISDALQALLKSKIVALGRFKAKGLNRIAEDVVEVCLGLS
jgi:hypothetical protein